MGNDGEVDKFLDSVSPLLAAGDLTSAAEVAARRWPPRALERFLASPSNKVLCHAAACLGLIGSTENCESIAVLLRHPRAEVREAAEDALWQLWMRAGSGAGNARLAEAVQLLDEQDVRGAARCLETLTVLEPEFAEAHHQLGLACFLLDDFGDALASYLRAAALNRLHYCAIAGAGHAYAAVADLPAALRHYRWALEIHPYLNDLREAVAAIEAGMRRRRPAAG